LNQLLSLTEEMEPVQYVPTPLTQLVDAHDAEEPLILDIRETE